MKVLKPTTIPFPNNGQFIRSSTATYIEDGILKTAAINEPRWQDGKLLLESEATNYAVHSNNFITSWATDRLSTLTANAGVSPSGSNDATSWIRGSNVYLYRQPSGEGIPSDVDTVGIFVKASGCNTLRISLFGPVPTTLAVCDFDLGLKTKTNILGSSGEIQEVGQGWFRLSIKSGNSTTPRLIELFMLGAGAGTGFFLYGTQFEKTNQTSHIPTTTVPVTRQADICIGNFSRASAATYIDNNGVLQTAGVNAPRIQNGKLLLEGGATNCCINNNVTSPTKYTVSGGDGTITLLSDPFWPVVLRITKTTGGAGSRVGIRWPVAAISDDQYTVGIWVRRPAAVVDGYSVYSDMTKVAGGVVSASKGLSLVPPGVWFRSTVTASGGGASYSGGYLYTWVEGAIGDYIDVALPCAWAGASDSSAVVTGSIPATRAADIHSAGLVYTTATDSRPLWSSTTTYSVGEIIRYNNIAYESLQATNLNKQPATNPTWWLSLGADNISAAFDGKVGSKTTATDKLRMIVFPGSEVDSVGYLETNAVVVNTSAVDSYGNIAYSNSTGFTESNIENWYDYFFVSPLSDPATQVVHQGIPSLDPGLFIGIEMTNPGTVEVGSVLMGYSTTIGKTQYGVKAGIVNYSKKESDEFGNVSIVERPYSKRMQGDVYVNNYDLNKVQRFLYNIRATPVLWMASDNPELAEVSHVYGFYKDFSTTISYPDVSMCNLDIEGLI